MHVRSSTLLPVLLLLSGCITTECLRENIEDGEARSSHRLSTAGIKDGICRIDARYVGEIRKEWQRALVYAFQLQELKLYLLIRFSDGEGGELTVTDKEPVVEPGDRRADLVLELAKVAPREVAISDLSGDSPRIFIQLSDSRQRDWIRPQNRTYEYDSLQGRAFLVSKGRTYRFDVGQDLQVSTTVQVASGIKSAGFLITVPFDIITSPIQGVILVWAWSSAFNGVH